MKRLLIAVALVLPLAGSVQGDIVFPDSGSAAAVTPEPELVCPCWDETTAGDEAVWGRSCGTGLDPDVAALCALGYIFETCTAGAPGTLLFFQWDAGAGTCELQDGGFSTITSASGLSATQIQKCIDDGAAGIIALGIACTPS